MKYQCDVCDYETHDKSNFNKHNKSDTHIKTVDYIEANPPPKYVCECGNNYSSRQNLSRHRLYYCKQSKEINVPSNTADVEKLELTIQLLKKDIEITKVLAQKEKEIEIAQTEIKLQKQHIEALNDYIKRDKPTNNNNYNISVKNYIQQNYPNAPALEGIQDYAKLTYDPDTETEDDLLEQIVYNYNHSNLHKYLGNFIIECYKKDDPTQQSLWSSDVSRLTYIIKELLANNKTMWNHDYKGIKIKQYIIEPLLKYIVKNIDKYIKNTDNYAQASRKVKEIDIDMLVHTTKMRTILIKIKTDELTDLSNNINKYIAPFFSVNKQESTCTIDKNDQISEENDQKIKKNNKIIKNDKILKKNDIILKKIYQL